MVALYTGFALVAQCLLVVYFLGRLRRPSAAARYGWIVYAYGLAGAGLGLLLFEAGLARRWWLGPLLYAAWAAYGFVVDSVLRIEWRDPIRFPVFGPYVLLYSITQVLLWIPLWFVHPALWAVYGGLFVAATWLNIRGHFTPRGSRAAVSTA